MPRATPGPYVASALDDARVDERDERGLMPLPAARAAVAAADAFRKGQARTVRGTSVTDADRLWAALLSLETADELVREARRLRWEFHVRGRDNLALHQRYGDAILPWLESRLDDEGVLFNVPWCVVPCLLAIGTRAALALALRARSVHDVLPGQAALGAGPGLFADDEEGEVGDHGGGEPQVDGPEAPQGFAGPTRGFELAHAWVAAHPEGIFLAVEMARAGNEDALGLLRADAAQVGSTSFDALEGRLGAEATRSLFAELGLALPSLPAEVEAVLDEAEVADVARGPILSISALDAAARQYDLPLWDNANVAITASRVRGFASPTGDVMTVETIAYHPASGDPPQWTCTAFGSRPTRPVDDQPLIDADDVAATWLDERRGHLLDGYSNHLRVGEHAVRDPFEGEVVVRVTRPLSRVAGEDVACPVGLPPDFHDAPAEVLDDVPRISAGESLTVQIGRRRPDLLFPTAEDLQRALGLDDATPIFDLDNVAWPGAGDPASSSLDVIAMITALARRRCLRRLPGPANTTPLHWLPLCAGMRSFDGDDPWPEGDPFAAAAEDGGPGITPLDSRLLRDAWPHGVSLLHAEAYNAEGSGGAIVERALVAGGVRWLVCSRVGACAIARAAGAVEAAWTLADPGIARSLQEHGLVTPEEARKLLASFVAGPSAPFERIGAVLVFVLEALVGPAATIEAFAAALAAAPPARWDANVDAVAAAAFEMGVLLRRTRRSRAPLRAALTEARACVGHDGVLRALDLVLGRRAAAERWARSEGDYLFVDDDPAWARERILDPATPASVEDLALLPVVGDALLDKYAARIDALVDPAWLTLQLPRARSPRAAALLARVGARVSR